MPISLHIQRLVLDGFAPGALDAAQLQAAVEAELARLLAWGGVGPELAGGGAYAALPGGAIAVLESGPQGLGVQIAQAVYTGLGGVAATTASEQEQL